MATLEILLPVPPRAADERSTVYDLDRGLSDVIVGLRLDQSWRSYFTVVDVWTELFERGPARPVRVLWTGDRLPAPRPTRRANDVEEWLRLVQIGVVGLGN